MAGPAPVVVEFIAKGHQDILKALRAIANVAAGVDKESVRAANFAASEKKRLAKEAAQAQAKELIKLGETEKAAQIAGTKFVQKQLQIRRDHMIANSIEQFKIADEGHKKINASSAKLSKDVQKNKEAEFKALEKLTEKWVAEEKGAANAVVKARDAAGKQEVASAQRVAKDILKAQNQARQEILRGGGGVASPALSPQARLNLLASAKGKTPEEQRKILEQANDMRSRAVADRKDRDAAAKEERERQAAITKEAEAGEKARAAIRERSAKMAGDYAGKIAAAKGAQEWRDRQEFARTVVGSGAKGIHQATSIAGRVTAGLAQGILNVGGGFSVEDAVQREVALQGRAASIAGTTDTGITKQQLLAKARAVGTAQGIDPEEVLRGFEAVKKLDDRSLPTALKVMPQMAKIATATGTDLGQLGELAANITASNEKITPDQLLKQLRIFTQQGIAGGVEISDFARYGSRITAGAGLFGGNREENEAVLGGAAQIARQHGGAASPAEATMAAQRFATDLQKHAGGIENILGKGSVTDGKGTLRSAEDVLVAMVAKTGGDVAKLPMFKLGERGNRVLTGVADIYREAGGGAKGEEAVRREFGKYKKEISEDAIEEKNKKRLAEVDMQLSMAMIELRTAVGTQLVPKLAELVPHLAKLIPTVSTLLSGLVSITAWAQKHPFAGFAALVTGFFMKELAAAKIAQTIQSMLTGAKPPGVNGVGGPPVPGVGSAVTKGVTLGLASAVVVANAELGYSGGQEGAQDMRAQLAAYQRGERDPSRSISPERAKAAIAAAQSRLDKTGVFSQVGNILASPVSDSASKEYAQYKSDQGLVQSKEGEALQKELAAALRENTAALRSQGGGPNAGPANAGARSRAQPIPLRTTD